ncbi:MAG: minor capsid protein [Haemophilus parainfluenzae]|nr:minor capsid protein [Haemophilus parainfluenzae]
MAYNYWEERFKRLKTVEMRKAERANADLARVYRETLRQLRAEVEQWYDRFAKENKISLAEARRILDNREQKEFKMTLADFIKEAKRLDLDPAHIRMLENASMRVRLTRSQEIYLKTAQYVEKLAKSQGWQLSGLMREVYTDSVYKTAYETQKVTGFENFRAVRERQIEEAISKPWAPDGADFSSRVWKNKTQLINSLQTDITQSLMTGTSTAQLSEKIAARFNTSYNQAYRLVETETAYIQEKAMLDTYDELGLEQYQICAVLDDKTSEICQNLDGKVFDRKDAKLGVTMPPFHCHCRSTTVPYVKDLLDDGGRVARDPKTGKTVEIPDMTYKEWKEKYVVKIDGNEEYNVIREIKGRPNKYVVDKILSGAYGAKINEEKQKPHMESTAGKGKSYLFDTVDPQELFNKYAGTGTMEKDVNGNNTNKEICTADDYIGVDGKSRKQTEKFKIHHSKQRTHVVPRKD